MTSDLFKRGHRIRLEVSSSNFPHYNINPNTGQRLGEVSLLDAKVTLLRSFSEREQPDKLL